MVALGHSAVYRNFYGLAVFLLTLPVTSASCERAHSKVDLVKSAVRASMGSERLENLVLISAEKSVLDSIKCLVWSTNLLFLREDYHCNRPLLSVATRGNISPIATSP